MEKILAAAFSNPVRLKLLYCLAKGRRNVQELIGNCGLSQSAVSQHLGKLRTVGLVQAQKEGKHVYYSLTYPKIGKLAWQIQVFAEEVKHV